MWPQNICTNYIQLMECKPNMEEKLKKAILSFTEHIVLHFDELHLAYGVLTLHSFLKHILNKSILELFATVMKPDRLPVLLFLTNSAVSF